MMLKQVRTFQRLVFLGAALGALPITGMSAAEPSAQAETEAREGPQVIVVDEAHQAMAGGASPRRGGAQPKVYAIDPAEAIGIDFRNATLKFNSGSRKFNLRQPNRVDVVFQSGPHYKRVYSPRQRRLELSPGTLRPVGKQPPFRGFPEGERFLVTLGYEFPRKASEPEGKVAPVWMGVVQVSAAPPEAAASPSKKKAPEAAAPAGDF